jgi:hypothetical protein
MSQGTQTQGEIYKVVDDNIRAGCYLALTGCGGCLSQWGVMNKPNDLTMVTCPANTCEGTAELKLKYLTQWSNALISNMNRAKTQHTPDGYVAQGQHSNLGLGH